MASTQPAARTASIDAGTTCGVVGLTVASLDRSIRYYTEALGFEVLSRDGNRAVLGAADTPLLTLEERTGAMPWMVDNMTGLYHFAVLFPTRADLGRWLRHYVSQPYGPPGQGDHIVSEALYLRDPDGHGIEMYADRPRATWKWENGRVRMGGGPVDVRGLIAEAERDGKPWSGLPAGTTMGHVHLQVGDLAEARRFYHETLGFDVVAEMDTALFVSAGGYHHHLGLNTWHSKGAQPAPSDTARLRFFSLACPSEQARADVVRRLDAAGFAHRDVDGTVEVDDPFGNRVALTVGALNAPRDVAELAAKS